MDPNFFIDPYLPTLKSKKWGQMGGNLLKPRVHDKRLYGTGTSRSIFFIIPSEICLRANSPCQYVNLYVGKTMVSH